MICLLPMCAYLSETSRMVQIYKALRAKGAAARIATHGGVHERLLRQEGIDYDLIEPHMDAARGQRFVMSNVGIGDPQIGQSYTLTHIQVLWEKAVAYQYLIEVSDDGSSW